MKRKAVKLVAIATVICLFSVATLFVALPESFFWLQYRLSDRKPYPVGRYEFFSEIPYTQYIRSSLSFEDIPGGRYFVDESAALQSAIDTVSLEGGGVVVLLCDLLTDFVELKDNVTLFIPYGWTLTLEGMRFGSSLRYLFASDADNICVTGGGTIRYVGMGLWKNPVLRNIENPPAIYDIKLIEYLHFQQKRTRKEPVSIRFVQFNQCTKININNIIIHNSPGWTISLENCEEAEIHHVVIDNNYHGQENDGIDICSSSYIKVHDCFISTGDDALCLKNDKEMNGESGRAVYDVLIENCYVRTATNGFKIGTGIYNSVSKVIVRNIQMEVSGLYPGSICGITLVSSEGGEIHDIQISDITMKNVLCPLFLRISDRNKFLDKPMQSRLYDITIENISAENIELPCIIAGLDCSRGTLYVENVSVKNLSASYRDASVLRYANYEEAPDAYPEAWMMGDVGAYGMFVAHARNINVESLQITPRKNESRLLFDCIL